MYNLKKYIDDIEQAAKQRIYKLSHLKVTVSKKKIKCYTFETEIATASDVTISGAGVYLVSETLKMPLGEFEGLIGNFCSGRLSLVSLQLQQASAYYLVEDSQKAYIGSGCPWDMLIWPLIPNLCFLTITVQLRNLS